MIFSPELAAKITLGEKTVTRRPVKFKDGAPAPCIYIPGRVYAVQLCRGGIAVDRIRVLRVDRETLKHPISAEEARLEGFASPLEFTGKWLALYGLDDPPREVWRIAFELVDAAA